MKVAVAASLVALLALAPAGAARSHGRCEVRGAAPVAKNSKAVLLSRDVQYDELTDGTEIYGCLRSRGRPQFLAGTTSDQYGSSSVTALALSGTFAAVSVSWGLADESCSGELTVYSLVGRRHKHDISFEPGDVHDGCPVVKRMVLNDHGFAAWVRSRVGAPDALYEVDNHPPRLLDAGGVDPRSLRLRGSTLSWTSGGVQRTAALH